MTSRILTRKRRRPMLPSLPRYIVGVLTLLASLTLGSGVAQAHFVLGLEDPGLQNPSTNAQTDTDLAAMRTADGSVVRLGLNWAFIAPSSRVAGLSDPSNRHYQWAAVDVAIRFASEHHYGVIAFFADAPGWAEQGRPTSPFVSRGAWNPNPTDYAAFVHAAAVRYGGSFADPQNPGQKLPRVGSWEPWNEPNIPGDFSAPHPVSAYRTLLNRAYGVLKAVHPDNTVVVGGLAPVSPVPGSIPPLSFGAQLLCVHPVGAGYRRTRPCPEPADFDVFGMHPYSLAATPTKPAYKAGDVLVGDMGKVQALVRAADRLRADAPAIHHQIWVTEFSWLTNPPSRQLGDSNRLAARYVAYSLYEMWRSGVSLVIWFGGLDRPNSDPIAASGGLYGSRGHPKLTLSALAFPVVAAVSHGTGLVWGRAPISHRVPVVVQHLVGHRWATVTRLRTGSDGVFIVHFRAVNDGVYRANVVGGPTSLTYDSRPIPPRRTHLP